jgi:diaminopimelate epimerase
MIYTIKAMEKILEFVKMQATGNDFIMVDARALDIGWGSVAKKMCDRHLGVGADGLMAVMESAVAGLRMRLFNADGSEAQISGNGLRCFAKYAVDRKLVAGPGITIETLAGIKHIETVQSGGKVAHARVNMGRPVLATADIPVSVEGKGPVLSYPLPVGGRDLELAFVSMGNPHAVCFIDEDVDIFPLHEIGPLVENHRIFPERTNFEIVNRIDRQKFKARVWERGVGETLACGSGSSATAVACRLKGYSDERVDITMPGGLLTVTWDGEGDVFLQGPVEEVFTGEFPL